MSLDIKDLKAELEGDTKDLNVEIEGNAKDLKVEIQGDIKDLKGDMRFYTLLLSLGMVGISVLASRRGGGGA